MKIKIKFFHWLPRILCILAILFVGMFALDAFSPGRSFWEQVGGFFMGLIPSLALTIFLLIAWKWEKIGGIIFILIGLATSPFIFNHNYQMNHSVGMSLSIILMINLPFVIVGILFLLNSFLKKREMKN